MVEVTVLLFYTYEKMNLRFAPLYDSSLNKCLVKTIDKDKRLISGMFVSKEGYILTCYHVVKKNVDRRLHSIMIEYGGRELKAKICRGFCNENKDIAVLKVDEGDGFIPPPLSPYWEPGDPITAKGYQEQDHLHGVVPIRGKIEPDESMLQVKFEETGPYQPVLVINYDNNAIFQPGMCGAPILDRKTRKVVALVAGTQRPTFQGKMSEDGEGVAVQTSNPRGFCIPLAHVYEGWPDFNEFCPRKPPITKLKLVLTTICSIMAGMILTLVIKYSLNRDFPGKETYDGQMPQNKEQSSASSGAPSVPYLTGDKAKFIRDVTYPDGETVKVNEVFEKILEIQNAGSVVWEDRFLQREGPVEGTGLLKSVNKVKIPTTAPGERVQISVAFQAPSEPGTTTSSWKMVDKSGRYMLPNQKPLYVTVQVTYWQFSKKSSLKKLAEALDADVVVRLEPKKA